MSPIFKGESVFEWRQACMCLSAALPDSWQRCQEKDRKKVTDVGGGGFKPPQRQGLWLSSTPHCLKIETSTRLQKYPGDSLGEVITANSIIRDAAAHPSPELGLQEQGHLLPASMAAQDPGLANKQHIGKSMGTRPSFSFSGGWGGGSAGLLAIPGEKFTPHPLPFDIQTVSLSLDLVNTDVSGNWPLTGSLNPGLFRWYSLHPHVASFLRFCFSVFSLGPQQGSPDYIVHCSGSLIPRSYFVESFRGSLFYHFLFLI